MPASSNIPERQSDASALRASELRYRRLFESAKDGILILDAETGKIVDANPFIMKTLGYSYEELAGKELWQLGFFKDVAAAKDAFEELRVNGYIRYEDLPLKTRRGHEIEVEFVSNVYRAGESEVIQCNIRDITERKQAEAEQSKLAAIVESSDDAIVGKTLEGVITTWNKSAEHIYGYSAEEVVGRSVSILIPSELHEELSVILEKIGRGGPVNHYETQRIRKDGRTIDVSLTVSAIKNAQGTVVGASAIARDITEFNLKEKTLEQTNRKLEATLAELSATTQQLWQASKLATMGELSASIAHELNNPLATVALRVESLLTSMGDDDQRRHALEIISQEVDRMARLVDNLLQFSRRSHRQISTLDIREEIANSVEFVHYHLRTHRIEVVRDFADPLPTIQVDRQQLRQLFLNLLTNASDAMSQGGTLTVRAQRGVLRETEAVQIDFMDAGEGITAENLKKIWEPFFTTKTEGKGTGLGLAICRRIVEEHGGTIEIKSETGRGTTVRMFFPATAGGAPATLG